MAYFEQVDVAAAMPVEAAAAPEVLFELGMMYSTGRIVPMDFIAAHKFFNLAAAKGYPEAARLRREVAEMMSETDIAEAQRAARAWMTMH
jgi:TPR repeat protein